MLDKVSSTVLMFIYCLITAGSLMLHDWRPSISCCAQLVSTVCGLQRIWSLGPKRTGPNFLLSSETTSSTGLFTVPDAAVVRLSAKQEKKSASHPAQADVGGPGGPQVEDPALRPSELAEADAYSELSTKV